MFYLKRVLECLLLPPFAPLLMIMLGLCLVRRRPKLGLGVAWAGALLSLLLMLPATVDGLMEPIENVATPLAQGAAKDAQAIVILGGGQRLRAPEYGGPTLNSTTLERVRYGARLSRATGLPILVSGGAPGASRPEAALMAESLQQDFGILTKWVEDGSENTEQNARNSAAMLKAAGVKHIVLVTHAAHMRRAIGYFTAEGLQITPAPTAFFRPMLNSENPLSWLPSASAAYGNWYAAHEWAGLIQQKIK